jgi:hypothetical protein
MARWGRVGGRGVVAAALAAAAMFAGHAGGAARAVDPRPADEPSAEPEPPRAADVDAAEAGIVRLAELVGRAARAVETQGNALRERLEGLHGLYRLLKSLGLSDREIALLVARQLRGRIEHELRDRSAATETRRLVDGLQDTVVRAAQEVDVRLNLGGEFVRRVREGVQAATTGREEAFLTIERGMTAARQQLRRLLSEEAED